MTIVDPTVVAEWPDLDLDETGTEMMALVIAAVEAHARKHYTVPETIDPADDADLILGCTMQCARLYKRRTTIEGIASFGEQYATRVARFDPDIDQMLDGYRKWAMA